MAKPEFVFDPNYQTIKIVSPDGSKTMELGLSNDGTLSVDGSFVKDQVDNSYEEYTYTGSRIDSAVTWTDNGKTQKIKEELFTYNQSGEVTQIVTNFYNSTGVLMKTVTEVMAYNAQKQITSTIRTVI